MNGLMGSRICFRLFGFPRDTHLGISAQAQPKCVIQAEKAAMIGLLGCHALKQAERPLKPAGDAGSLSHRGLAFSATAPWVESGTRKIAHRLDQYPPLGLSLASRWSRKGPETS